MQTSNILFIATSLDGYIADKKGGLDWLSAIPNPNNEEMGFTSLMNRIDALVMGRATFETVCSFGIEWPYQKPVFVLSNTMSCIPKSYEHHAELIQGSTLDILRALHQRGFHRLYIDGGKTIQGFLKLDLIDELIISTIPILLGSGIPLFGTIPTALEFELKESKVFLGQIVQRHYIRKR